VTWIFAKGLNMLTGRRRFLLLMPAAVAAATMAPGAMAAEPDTLAASAGAPVELGAKQVSVKLAPAASSKALSARVAGIDGDRRVYLVVRGLGTDAPPETLYQLYLGLPPGVAPTPDGAYYVGSLNFFNSVNGGAGAARSDPRFLSFDVTGILKALHSRNSLGGDATVTIVPASTPRASAKPVISEIALVAQ
jgi:tyrosinase